MVYWWYFSVSHSYLPSLRLIWCHCYFEIWKNTIESWIPFNKHTLKREGSLHLVLFSDLYDKLLSLYGSFTADQKVLKGKQKMQKHQQIHRKYTQMYPYLKSLYNHVLLTEDVFWLIYMCSVDVWEWIVCLIDTSLTLLLALLHTLVRIYCTVQQHGFNILTCACSLMFCMLQMLQSPFRMTVTVRSPQEREKKRGGRSFILILNTIVLLQCCSSLIINTVEWIKMKMN